MQSCKKITLIFFCFFCPVISSLPVHVAASEKELANLEWQFPGHGSFQKRFIRFRAQAFRQKNHHFHSARSFAGEVAVTGRAGQPFTVCARGVESDDFVYTSAMAGADHLHTLLLTKNTGLLEVNGGIPCPSWLAPEYPYNTLQLLRSTEPFLATWKEKSQKSDRPISALPSNPVPQKNSLLSSSGAGLGFDDHNDFKRPPFMPLPDKLMANLILLPTQDLPANWREYLPFAGLYHWLVDQPEDQTGLTLLVQFDGQPPITLRISQAEYPAMAEHLLNARQLLYWLAHKLNGRESMTQWLLGVLEHFYEGSVESFLDEERANRIRQQLQIVLEQPDTEFSLSFELDQLGRVLNSNRHDTMGIVQLPEGTTDQQSEKPSPDTSPEEADANNSSLRSDKQNENKDNLPSRDGANQPPNSPTPPGVISNHEQTQSYFLLNVNGHTFMVNKHHLNPKKRGAEEPASIIVQCEDISNLSVPLDRVEETAAMSVIQRLARDADTLDYLVKYGTEATKWALQDFYPVSVLAHSDQHLIVDRRAVIPEADLECPVCQEGILKQANLVKADCNDLLHARCFMEYLRQSPEEDSPRRCPICRKGIPELSRLLDNQHTLERTMLEASAKGNTALVHNLLMLGVNADAVSHGQTVLHRAAEAGHYDIAQLLIRHGAAPDKTDDNSMTPRQIATEREHLSIADMLTEAIKTPEIFYIVGHGQVELLEEWLDQGESPDLTRPSDGLTLLHLATKNNHPQLADMLLNVAENLNLDIINATDMYGRTPLHYACDFGLADIAGILVYRDADTNQRDLFDKTPLMLAAERGHADIVRLMEPELSDTELTNPSEEEAINLPLQGSPAHQIEQSFAAPAQPIQPLLSEERPDYYTLKIAQTIFKIPHQGVSQKLSDTLVFWLNAQCQDCGDVVWLSLSRHANGHIVICSQCQQFIPPEGSLTDRQAALRAHQSVCIAREAGTANPYNPAVTARDYSTLSLFFRFASLESTRSLLAESDSALITATLEKRGYQGQQPLHVLFAHGTTEAVNDFLAHQQSLLHNQPDLLRMQQRDGWSPLHMLFYKGSEESIRLFVDFYSDFLMNYPLMLQYCTTDGWTALHTLFRYQPADVIQYFLEHNKPLFEHHPVVLEKHTRQDWNSLHILFFYGRPVTAIAFIESFSDLLNRQSQLLEKNNKNKDTPINILLSKGTVKTMALFFQQHEQWLANSPRKITEPNRQGQTLLHNFCLKATPDLIRQLFDKNADLITLDHLTRKADHTWTVLDCLYQRTSPQVVIPWLREHLQGGIQPLHESLFTELLEHTKSWQDFVGHIVSNPTLKANPLLGKIADAGRILNPLPGGVLLEGMARSCPITGEVIQTPVITNPCGHEFEQEALQQWMDRPAARMPEGKFRCPRCSRGFSDYIRSYPDN